MSPFNILFTSSGRRVALIRHFKETLKNLEVEGKIVCADLQKNAPTLFIADATEQVPRVTDPAYIDILIDICKKHQIKLLIPLIDTELLLLSENREKFEQLGVTVLVCSSEANRICRNKNNTAEFFASINVGAPKVLEPEVVLSGEEGIYPVLIKPFDGSCSIGVAKVYSREELQHYQQHVRNPILQEFIEGDEYTVDVLVDFNGDVRCIVPRKRIETRAGEVSKGMTEKVAKVMAETRKVAEALPGALGCLTIQCFLTSSGEVKFIEINPRFGGGFPLSIAAGADFPKWIIQMMLGESPSIEFDGWKEGTVMLRYDDAVFTTIESIS